MISDLNRRKLCCQGAIPYRYYGAKSELRIIAIININKIYPMGLNGLMPKLFDKDATSITAIRKEF